MMLIKNEHEIGDIVYLVTDPEQCRRIITSMEIFFTGEVIYKLAVADSVSAHYAFEISKEVNIEIKTNG